jgi:outer membrane immunogenic protein
MRGVVRTVISCALLSVSCVAAWAADLPVRTATPAVPVPAPASSWTGFYLGGDVGAMATDAQAKTTNTIGIGALPAATLSFAQPVDFSGVGFRGGAFAGYDWQFAPAWVAGIEGDWHHEDINKTQSGFTIGLPFGGGVTSNGDNRQISANWDASVRARLGYLVTPTFLVFATGGGAWMHINTQAFCDGTALGAFVGYCSNIGFPSQTLTSSQTVSGWTVGGGIETMLWANWIARAEYRYSDYGTTTVSDTIVSGILTQTHSFSLKLATQVAEFGLRYKF